MHAWRPWSWSISGSFFLLVRAGRSSLALVKLGLGLSAYLCRDPHFWSRAKSHDPKNKNTDTSAGVGFLCWVAGLSLRQGEKLGHLRGAMGWAVPHPHGRGASWGGSGVWSGRLPGEVSSAYPREDLQHAGGLWEARVWCWESC